MHRAVPSKPLPSVVTRRGVPRPIPEKRMLLVRDDTAIRLAKGMHVS